MAKGVILAGAPAGRKRGRGSKAKNKEQSRKPARRPELSPLISSEEKLYLLHKEIADSNCDPIVFLELPWGLLIMRIAGDSSDRKILPITYRIGTTIFGTPFSEREAYRILYSYRFHSRVNDHKTFSDIKASEAAHVLSEVAGRRFQQIVRRNGSSSGEDGPMIAAISYVFEISGNPPYGVSVFEVHPNGRTERIVPGRPCWPPMPESLGKHAEEVSRKCVKVASDIMDKISYFAGREPRQPEAHLIMPFVGAIAELLVKEHVSKFWSKDARMGIETVYLSARAIEAAHAQEAEGLHGEWNRVWNRISWVKALMFYKNWLGKVSDMQKTESSSGEPPNQDVKDPEPEK